MSPASRPIIVVTGANTGVGFGICQRLLLQLSQSSPPDAYPPFEASFGSQEREGDAFPLPCEGLTLIMACRSLPRAEAARTKLYNCLDSDIARRQKSPDFDSHAISFRKNLTIEVHVVDLANLTTIFKFAEDIAHQYPYISHVVCNAGVGGFSSIDWVAAVKQLSKDPVTAVSSPEFYLQNAGERSVDNLGWVWQCNVFGHYVLFRALAPLLSAPAYPHDSRVIWISSLEAKPNFFDLDDWQLIKSEHAYEGTKYQAELLGTRLDQLALESISDSNKRIRHFVAHPGVCSTSIANTMIGPVLDFLKLMIFYVARWCGSPNHTITGDKAAVSIVHLCLVSLSLVTFSKKASVDGQPPFKGTAANGQAKPEPVSTLRYGSETDRWGAERIGYSEVKAWKEYAQDADKLLENCEKLYRSKREEEYTELVYERASERM